MSRTLLFDVDGVLIHGVHAKPHLRRMWSTHLKEDLGVDEEQYVREFIREGFVRNVMLDRRSLVAELEEWLPKAGYAGSPLSFIAYWLHRDSQLNQPLLAVIRRLRAAPGVGRLYIATNQEHLRAFHLWSTLGLQHIFDDMLYAARLGAMKPDRAFFGPPPSAWGRRTDHRSCSTTAKRLSSPRAPSAGMPRSTKSSKTSPPIPGLQSASTSRPDPSASNEPSSVDRGGGCSDGPRATCR